MTDPMDADPTADTLVQRAALLADLGRYDDAVADLTEALQLEPGHRATLTLLARVQLTAGRPAECLASADAALDVLADADPDLLGVRAMALIDLGRYPEAAAVADGLLRQSPDDPRVLSLGAAILAESRNGQRALDAAWRAVQRSPETADTHLVLGLVAARLGQFNLAEQAYREALARDPALATAQEDIGVVRWEQRRYTAALEHLAESAALRPHAPSTGRSIAYGLRRVLHVGVGYALVTPPLVGYMLYRDTATSRTFAAVLGVLGLLVVAAAMTRLAGPLREQLALLLRKEGRLAVALGAVVAGPLLLLSYAALGSPWPLVAAILAGFTALVALHPSS